MMGFSGFFFPLEEGIFLSLPNPHAVLSLKQQFTAMVLTTFLSFFFSLFLVLPALSLHRRVQLFSSRGEWELF